MTGTPTILAGLAAVVLAASLAHVALAQVATKPTTEPTATQIERPTPRASHGGKAEVLPPQPLGESADTVNQLVLSETVDGIIIVVTIDGSAVKLDSATPARIPRRMSSSARQTGGDTVKATGLVGGRVVATTIIPDNVLNASEGTGLVRTTLRQVSLVLATDSPIDTVVIEAPATSASASLDVRRAYAQICDADPRGKWCPR